MESFGEHLNRFSLTVHTISEDQFEKVFESLIQQLGFIGVMFGEFLVPTTVDKGERGLRSYFQRGGQDWARRLKDASGNYQGQISYAFDRESPSWIVALDKSPLRNTESYINLLVSETGPVPIPKYVSLTKKDIRTSIMYPLVHDGHHIGIVNFESTSFLRPTSRLREEFDLIAESIEVLSVLRKACITQSHNVDRAIGSLSKHRGTVIPGTCRVFIASSTEADHEVMGLVKETLEDFEIEAEHWKENSQPGDIRAEIWKNLSVSEFGICYFSEPAKGDQAKYKDNSNVLLEAGMMYALVQTTSTMRAWIPIREAQSRDLPFDLSAERALVVPRDLAGKLNRESFRSQLSKMFLAAGFPKAVENER